MRVQKQRIPEGFVLRPKNGLLVPIPAAQISAFNSVAHHSGYAVGAGAHVVYMPIELGIDAVRAAFNAIAATTFGEGVALGWNDVGNWKNSVATFIQIRKLPMDQQKLMLAQTYPESQQRQVRIMISRMTDFQISRSLADRITPNEYIDENVTYCGRAEEVKLGDEKPAQANAQPDMTNQKVNEFVGAFTG